MSKDKLRDSFDELMKKIGAQNAPKSILVNEQFPNEFEANGVKYIVVSPNDIFNIDKQTAYHNIKMAFDLNKTPTEIYQAFDRQLHLIMQLFGSKDADKVKITEELVRSAMNNKETFKSRLAQRFPAALFLCTIFIVREGEDLSKQWDFESAMTKIDDWLHENIKPIDFFRLALSSSTESQKIILENLESI